MLEGENRIKVSFYEINVCVRYVKALSKNYMPTTEPTNKRTHTHKHTYT